MSNEDIKDSEDYAVGNSEVEPEKEHPKKKGRGRPKKSEQKQEEKPVESEKESETKESKVEEAKEESSEKDEEEQQSSDDQEKAEIPEQVIPESEIIKITNLSRHAISAGRVFIPRGATVEVDSAKEYNKKAMEKLKAAHKNGQVQISE